MWKEWAVHLGPKILFCTLYRRQSGQRKNPAYHIPSRKRVVPRVPNVPRGARVQLVLANSMSLLSSRVDHFFRGKMPGCSSSLQTWRRSVASMLSMNRGCCSPTPTVAGQAPARSLYRHAPKALPQNFATFPTTCCQSPFADVLRLERP